MEGHRLSTIGEKERQARVSKSGNRKKTQKVRPSCIVGPTLVVKDTDNYESTNGIEGEGSNISNGVDAKAFADLSRRLEETMDMVRQMHERAHLLT